MDHTWILATTPVHLGNWLRQYIRMVNPPSGKLDTEQGQFVLQAWSRQPLRSRGEPGPVVGVAACELLPDGVSVRFHHEVIRFMLIPLDAGRIEVQARCLTLELEGYYQEICAAILARWPDQAGGGDGVNQMESTVALTPVSKPRKGQPRRWSDKRDAQQALVAVLRAYRLWAEHETPPQPGDIADAFARDESAIKRWVADCGRTWEALLREAGWHAD